MANTNGKYILEILADMGEPSTLKKIVSHVGHETGIDPIEIKEAIKKTLDGGVRYGYVQKTNRKYSTFLDGDNVSDQNESLVVTEARNGQRRRASSKSRSSRSASKRRSRGSHSGSTSRRSSSQRSGSRRRRRTRVSNE